MKSQLINRETQILIICSDITGIKEAEIEMQKMRAAFFSSVAHELRTPLNSVIPILNLIKQKLQQNPLFNEEILNLVKIALCSATHLQNVIEDALDITRLENGNFVVYKDFFNLIQMIAELCDVMRFQFEQKRLALNLIVSERAPQIIYSDAKRLKQILFNLMGNALKFTTRGSIALSVDFDQDL